MKTFILGSNDRAALTVSRELGKQGFHVEIISLTSSCISLKSKYVKKSYILKNREDINEIFNEIIEIIEPGSFVIPINDYFLTLVLSFFQIFKDSFIIPYNSKESILKIIDKYNLLIEASKIGIDTPDSLLIKNIDSFYKIDKNTFKYPLILKPRISCLEQNNRIITTGVKKVNNYNELEMQIRLNIGYVDVIIQNYIEGFGRAINFFAVNGDIKNYFQYERIHEPGFGGGSSLRKSIKVEPKLKKTSLDLLKSSNYTGIGMIEYRYCPSEKKYFIMEINARFWGSLSLPVFSGINFPVILYDYFVKGEISKSIYLAEKYSKHILKDSKWLFIKLKNNKIRLFFSEIKSDFVRFVRNDMTFDVEKKNDFKPSVFQYALLFSNFFKKIHEISYRFLIFIYKNKTRNKDRKQALNLLLTDNMNIVFVCRGNIIRSAFAENYFNKLTENRSYSCGTLYKSERLSPVKALEAAKNIDVDLQDHKSKYINDLEIDVSNSIYFVMNPKQYIELSKRKKYENVYFLGIFDEDRSLVIKDPYYNPYDLITYSKIFEQIKSNIDLMIK